MVVCMLLGVLMVFRHSIRYLFGEDLDSPNPVDRAWRLPTEKQYHKKIVLELHYFNPKVPKDMILEKLKELREKDLGIHTVLLSGSSKIGTNAYIREIAKESWAIQEIRLHGTEAINIYAFINLIRSTSTSLKRILIWNNRWDVATLSKIRGNLPKLGELILMED